MCYPYCFCCISCWNLVDDRLHDATQLFLAFSILYVCCSISLRLDLGMMVSFFLVAVALLTCDCPPWYCCPVSSSLAAFLLQWDVNLCMMSLHKYSINVTFYPRVDKEHWVHENNSVFSNKIRYTYMYTPYKCFLYVSDWTIHIDM